MELPDYVSVAKDGVVIDVLVQPRAARDALVGVHGPALKMKVTAPPVDDRANEAAIALLASILDVPAARVTLLGGRKSRHKRFAVGEISPEKVTDALAAVLSSRAQ